MAPVVLLALACGSSEPTDPLTTSEGQACAKAYKGTVGSLSALFMRRGQPLPGTWPEKEHYVERCMALELPVATIACLDPTEAQRDPKGCTTAFEPMKSEIDAFSRWFNGELKKAAEAPLPEDADGVQGEEESGGQP